MLVSERIAFWGTNARLAKAEPFGQAPREGGVWGETQPYA